MSETKKSEKKMFGRKKMKCWGLSETVFAEVRDCENPILRGRRPFEVYVYLYECTNVRMHECTNVRMYEFTNVRMYGRMYGRMYERTNVRTVFAEV